MGQTDFEYGHNITTAPASEPEPLNAWTKTGCTEPIRCFACGKLYGICHEIEASLNGATEDNMIPRHQEPSNTRNNRGSRKKQSGLPFLNVEHLTFEKQPAKILAARVQDDNFKPGQQVVAVKVLFKTNTYLWNLRPNNPNLEILGDGLGDNEQNWEGRSIMLFKEQDDFDNKEWMRCEVMPEPASKKK